MACLHVSNGLALSQEPAALVLFEPAVHHAYKMSACCSRRSFDSTPLHRCPPAIGSSLLLVIAFSLLLLLLVIVIIAPPSAALEPAAAPSPKWCSIPPCDVSRRRPLAGIPPDSDRLQSCSRASNA